MSLNKIDLVKMTIEQLDIPRKESICIVESVFEIIKGELNQGNNVKISGFGKWTVNAKPARRGRNPQTGKEMMIEAKRVVTFLPSKILRGTLNSGK